MALPAVVLALGIGSSYWLYQVIATNEEQTVRAETEKEATIVKDIITTSLETQVLALERMASRWSLRNGTPLKDWRSDAQNYIAQYPGLKFIKWIDTAYEERWVEPQQDKEAAADIGMHAIEKHRNQLARASNWDQPILLPPEITPQGFKVLVSYSAVKRKGNFDGLIAGVFDIDELLASVLRNENLIHFGFELIEGGKSFYQSRYDKPLLSENILIEKSFKVMDQTWILRVFPTNLYNTNRMPFIAEIVLIFGVILALVLSYLLYTLMSLRAQAKLLSNQEDMLKNYVKYTPVSLAMFDTNMHYVAVSDRWIKDFNLEGRDILGKSHFDIFPDIPTKHPTWLANHWRAIGGEIVQAEEPSFMQLGTEKQWLRYEMHPWKQAGHEHVGMIMFAENITERKVAETFKDDFIANMNHELRTPLTSIQGALGLLKFMIIDKIDKKSFDLLNIAYNNCMTLTKLVNDFLDLEKISLGKVIWDMRPNEMNSIIKKTIELNEPLAMINNVELDYFSIEKEIYCNIDANRFTQALTNIISNAIKFTFGNDMIEIHLSKKSDSEIVISVTDNGSGIPENFRDKVFDKFAQADCSSTKAQEGSGLGLSITKAIIEEFDGEITFTTQVNSGTTFSLILPICEPDQKREAA